MCWLIFHIPGLSFVFFKVLLPFWNFLLSSIESLFYLRKRKRALSILSGLKQDIKSSTALHQWYLQEEFEWKRDPLRGLLDFSSKVWVTIARNKGDCDDMMMLAATVLAGKYDEVRKCCVYSKAGKGHALCLLKAGPSWFVMSNQFSYGVFDTKEDAARSHYGEDTAYCYIY